MAKVLISLDEALLSRIDRAAGKRGLSRSGFLAELARRDLGGIKGAGSGAKARAALRSIDRLFAHAPLGDAAALIRRERDDRTEKLSRA